MEQSSPPGATLLTNDELHDLKVKYITTRGELNELEIKNINEGLLWLNQRSESFDVLTDESLREIHKRLFCHVWKWAGTYRKTMTNIGDVNTWNISTEVRNTLDDARYWLENVIYSPLEATARLHHRLVWVHPFPDGNGRWARIVADKYLSRLDPEYSLNWLEVNIQNDSEHRNQYIKGLKAADKHEFEPLLKFIRNIATKP